LLSAGLFRTDDSAELVAPEVDRISADVFHGHDAVDRHFDRLTDGTSQVGAIGSVLLDLVAQMDEVNTARVSTETLSVTWPGSPRPRTG
jgi:hypothetical protein